MTCKCSKLRSGSYCRFCTPTSVWWNRNESCWVWRCTNPAMLTDPPEWAFGNTRRATVDDSPTGAVIEDADWVAVRSCFCTSEQCKHFCTRGY